MQLKILFAGTPNFSVPALEALINNHKVLAVLTQPDRPAGRGRKITKSPVKICAEQHGIKIFQPKDLKEKTIQDTLKAFYADVVVVVAYGIILPTEFLTITKYGCINIHASILPRWRGAAPIHRAILSGDTKTGISIMQMDAGLDTGDILRIDTITIDKSETTAKLQDRLAKLGAQSILQALSEINNWQPRKQNPTDSTYANKISKQEALINWQDNADKIYNQIRGFNPWPVAQSIINNTIIRIWSAEKELIKSDHKPGEIITFDKNYLSVATKDGLIKITKLQLPDKKAMPIADFFNSKQPFKIGDIFG